MVRKKVEISKLAALVDVTIIRETGITEMFKVKFHNSENEIILSDKSTKKK